MTTTHFITMIQSAELGTHRVVSALDPRFVPNAHASARAFSARVLRSGARGSLRLAARLDPACA